MFKDGILALLLRYYNTQPVLRYLTAMPGITCNFCTYLVPNLVFGQFSFRLCGFLTLTQRGRIHQMNMLANNHVTCYLVCILTRNSHIIYRYLASLNSFIKTAYIKFMEFFDAASTISDIDEHFNMDEFSDVTMLNKPMIFISPSEINSTHQLLLDHQKHGYFIMRVIFVRISHIKLML